MGFSSYFLKKGKKPEVCFIKNAYDKSFLSLKLEFDFQLCPFFRVKVSLIKSAIGDISVGN